MSKLPPLPDWCGPPSATWSLLSIKNGAHKGTFKFLEYSESPNQTRFTLGRGDDVDIEASHPSCSRRHAVIQFSRVDNCPFIMDLGSTHGTKICGKRISKGVWEKIVDGQWVCLGEGERRYCFEGPREEDDEVDDSNDTEVSLDVVEGEPQKQQEDQQQKSGEGDIELAALLKKTKEKNMVSTASQQSASQQSASQSARSKKAEEKQERFNRKKQKLDNMVLEMDRIEAKKATSDKGLSKGQEDRLNDLIVKVEKQRSEVEAMRSEINGSEADATPTTDGDNENTNKRRRQEDDYDNDGEYENSFFDRIASTSSSQPETHTLSSLLSLREKTLSTQLKGREKAKTLKSKLRNREDEVESLKAEGEIDPLDLFMKEEGVRGRERKRGAKRRVLFSKSFAPHRRVLSFL